LWAITVSNGGHFVPAVTEIALKWAASARGASGLISHFGAERHLLRLFTSL